MSVKQYNFLMNKRPDLSSPKFQRNEFQTKPRFKIFSKSPSQPDFNHFLTERAYIPPSELQVIGSFHSPSEQQIDIEIAQLQKKPIGKFSFQSIHLSGNRLQDVFNSISDFNDKQQILSALKSLDNVFQRVKLIDKILLRREEIKNAKDIVKIKKLNPLFIRLKKKITSRLNENSSKQCKSSTPRVKSQQDQDEERDKVIDPIMQNSPSSKMRQSHQIALKWVTERRQIQIFPHKPTLQQVMSEHTKIKKTRKVSEVSEQLVKFAKLKEAQTYFKPRRSIQIETIQSKVALLRQQTIIQQ